MFSLLHESLSYSGPSSLNLRTQTYSVRAVNILSYTKIYKIFCRVLDHHCQINLNDYVYTCRIWYYWMNYKFEMLFYLTGYQTTSPHSMILKCYFIWQGTRLLLPTQWSWNVILFDRVPDYFSPLGPMLFQTTFPHSMILKCYFIWQGPRLLLSFRWSCNVILFDRVPDYFSPLDDFAIVILFDRVPDYFSPLDDLEMLFYLTGYQTPRLLLSTRWSCNVILFDRVSDYFSPLDDLAMLFYLTGSQTISPHSMISHSTCTRIPKSLRSSVDWMLKNRKQFQVSKTMEGIQFVLKLYHVILKCYFICDQYLSIVENLSCLNDIIIGFPMP